MKRLFAKELWPDILPDWRPWKRYLKMGLLLLSAVFLCLALFRPQWGYELREIKRKGVDLFVLVDTSTSMLAEDIKPNRMERVRRKLIDLLSFLQGDRIGLIAFAGTSYVACPLTTDYSAFSIFVDELDTDLIPIQGTDILGAVSKAIASFSTDGERSRAILLLTDGEDTTSGMTEVIRKANAAQVRLFIMGMGTPEGAPIPLPDGRGFKKDDAGNVVLSRLSETSLQEAARATQGTYVRSVTGDEDIEKLYLKGIKQVLEAGELKSETKNVGKERFQFPLAIALFLLMLEPFITETVSLLPRKRKWFSRGSKIALMIFGLTASFSAEAFFGFDKANRYFDQGEYQKAEEGYQKLLARNSEDPEINYNLGATQYREEKYPDAETHFLKALNSKDPDLQEKALYNLGNTLYRQDKLEQAVDAYNKALQIKPDDKNAKANRDFVLEKLKQKERQKQDQQDQQGKQEEDKQQSEDQQQEDQDKDSQEEQKEKQQDKHNQQEQEEQKEDQGGSQHSLSPGEADRWLNSIEDNPRGAIKDMIHREAGRKGDSPEAPAGGKDW